MTRIWGQGEPLSITSPLPCNGVALGALAFVNADLARIRAFDASALTSAPRRGTSSALVLTEVRAERRLDKGTQAHQHIGHQTDRLRNLDRGRHWLLLPLHCLLRSWSSR